MSQFKPSNIKIITPTRYYFAFVVLFLSSFFFVKAQKTSLQFKGLQIIVSKDIKPPLRNTYIKVLQEEIEKRTSIKPEISNLLSEELLNVILCLNSTPEVAGEIIPAVRDVSSPANKTEGYRVYYDNNIRTLWITGADERGILYGIGEFLRKAKMKKGEITINAPIDIITSPAYPIRGHQLGYRNTANSYDAWGVKEYEQYIRDLVIFGTNAIENIPLGRNDSKHFRISRKEMNKEISLICKRYGIAYWVWIPVNENLENTGLFQGKINYLDKYFEETPYLSDIFIPGGDPGNNHPKYLLPFIKKLHDCLVKYHPDAGLWLSLQGFSEEDVDYFYKYLYDNKPGWLKGVVSGPGSPDEAETRYRLPKQYLHRLYPDITHNIRCQFPVQHFDQALALTIGREGINPMPVFYSAVFREHVPFTDGFVSYSDGCHDDVNKVIWSSLGWNPDKDINEILKEYCRYFFSPDVEESTAAGILALEKNWYGPLKDNGSVEPALTFWKLLEREHPEFSDNWRWQMLQLRAVYDAYERRRLIVEKNLEKEANRILSEADVTGMQNAMTAAMEKIFETEDNPVSPELRKEIAEYCHTLYELIGLQTSVNKYGASNAERGAILDFMDYPLNNRWWYEDEFKKIDTMATEEARQERLDVIITWEDPGPGSYYDDISNIANSPHVKSTVADATDFAWWDNGMSRRRLSTQVFQFEPVLEYNNLDPYARYLIRVSGYGDALIRVDGQRLEPVIYNKGYETFKEFVVPQRLIGDMEIKVTFDKPEESRLNWRKHSKVSDVWLLKR